MRLPPLSVSLFLIAVLFSGSTFAAGLAASDDSVTHAGGLTCFSIQPPGTPTNRPTPHTPASYQTCDQLCAVKHAACTAATSNENPMRACASIYYDPEATLCRCCAVER
jgi:hypothetical protein